MGLCRAITAKDRNVTGISHHVLWCEWTDKLGCSWKLNSTYFRTHTSSVEAPAFTHQTPITSLSYTCWLIPPFSCVKEPGNMATWISQLAHNEELAPMAGNTRSTGSLMGTIQKPEWNRKAKKWIKNAERCLASCRYPATNPVVDLPSHQLRCTHLLGHTHGSHYSLILQQNGFV